MENYWRNKRRRLAKWAAAAIVGLSCIALAAPILWLLDTALMGQQALYSTSLHVLPVPLSGASFSQLVKDIDFGRDFINSTVVSCCQTVGVLVVGLLAAYAFARIEWKGRDAVFLTYVAALAVPIWVLLVPLFLIVKDLHWLNTYQGLIVPGLISPLAIFLLRQFMLTFPRELEDAAKVDGASLLRTLFGVIVPNITPAIIAAGIFVFLDSWNNLLWPLVVVSKTNLDTIPLGLSQLVIASGAGGGGASWSAVEWGPLMMGSLLAALPTLALFVIGQRKFVRGLTFSGLKG
jgi:ABC-type glycerol-3-phosphate transport system permease component